MTKNLDKLLSTLERGPLPYAELERRSAIPSGSFSRVIGQAIQSGQVVNEDGKYRLRGRTPHGINHSPAGESDSSASPMGATESATITDSDSGVDESSVPETLPKSIFRVGKRDSGRADTLTVTITNTDSTTETISHAEHQRRKGYEGVMP